ncbi:maleylpyruvate isomerase family mycothiol-dependent enzyme [Jannaschia sp. R86511]|uniref:maleylpyruvate isomerase family mycothiol-dependent enzyme n=1 Tax=Jannaschia sp. R86511 TaxID=3093853 RepID=UPI0036D36EFD
MSASGRAASSVLAAAVERRRLADVLDGLDPTQWQAASLCAGWTVRTVVGHLVAALDPSPRPLLAAVVRARGDVHRANTDLAGRVAEMPPAQLVQLLRDRADRRLVPPVVGARGPLTDVVVHGADVCRPLGLPHEPAPSAVEACLDFVTTGRPVGFVPRGRLRGLRLVATDRDRAWGAGTPVSGPAVDLLLAACGRRVALEALTGHGAAVLRERIG